MKNKLLLGAGVFCSALYFVCNFSLNTETNSLQELKATAGGTCTSQPCAVCTNADGSASYGKEWCWDNKPVQDQ